MSRKSSGVSCCRQHKHQQCIHEAPEIMIGRVSLVFFPNPYEWTDEMATTAGCDVIRQLGGYPSDSERRALYKHWFGIYASQQWSDAFDGLMLQCMAFTPSPTAPTQPLFRDCFTRVATETWDPVLDACFVRQLVARLRYDDGERPETSSRHRLVVYLGDLLYGEGCESEEALNEAGMIIGFCCFVFCVAGSQNSLFARTLFKDLSRTALNTLFPTSFDGPMPHPDNGFLASLRKKILSPRGIAIGFAVVLPVAQYVFLKNAGSAAPAKDLAFLNRAFMDHTKYCSLGTIDLLQRFAAKTRCSMQKLNDLLGSDECKQTRERVKDYLRKSSVSSSGPYSMPWCRLIGSQFSQELDVMYNIPYVLRILCFLHFERLTSLTRLRAMTYHCEVNQQDFDQARQWARNFRLLLDKGLFRTERPPIASEQQSGMSDAE